MADGLTHGPKDDPPDEIPLKETTFNILLETTRSNPTLLVEGSEGFGRVSEHLKSSQTLIHKGIGTLGTLLL